MILGKRFFIYLLFFCILNLILYIFILFFQGQISFQTHNYQKDAFHYIEDPRTKGGSFDFLNALGQYDAQWYFKIANTGYSKSINIQDKQQVDSIAWVFFPLYPAILYIFNLPVQHIELTAFILSNVLMIAAFVSLFFVVSRLYSQSLAIKTAFLLFVFPLSIFYRSYFTEGLLLLELVWFSYFLIKKKWFASAIFLGLLTVTKGNGLFLVPVFFYYLFIKSEKKMAIFQKAKYSVIAFLPFMIWVVFNFYMMGNPVYFLHARTGWGNGLPPFIDNLTKLLLFPALPIHYFQLSQLDILFALLVALILVKSRKTLKPELWWILFTLWLGPLLTTTTMSYARYQIVAFPAFLYLAQVLHGYKYVAVLLLFLWGLLITSLFFVNWYWIG